MEWIVGQGREPVDRLAVAALLESHGLRDVDARERFGVPRLFDLAEELFPRCRRLAREGSTGEVEEPPVIDVPGVDPPPILSPFRAYIRGGFFFVPLGLQLACLLAFSESMWASLHFTAAQASVVAGSVGLSFVVTAGFIQALGYLGPIFAGSGKYMLERRVTYRALGIALGAVIGVGLAVYGVNRLAHIFPEDRVRVGLMYYALQCGWLLSNAVLYMLRHYVLILVATVGGLAMVQISGRGLGTGLYVSHWVGVSSAIVLSLAFSAMVLRRRARFTEGDLRLAELPDPGIVLRSGAPSFLYGVMYFSFLFSDRLIAWSAGEHPLAVWFNSNYELGLDWALISVVGAMAYLEVIVNALSLRLSAAQSKHRGGEAAAHNRDLKGFYLRRMGIMLGLVLALGVVVHLVVLFIAGLPGAGDVTRYLNRPDTRSVHLWAVAGYGMLALGLANAVVLGSLSLRGPVNRGLAAALVVAVPLSLVLSRDGPYWWSVIGMTVGAVIFLITTTVSTWRALSRVDYYSFARY